MIDTTKYTQALILKRHWPLAVATALTVVAVIVPVALGLPNLYRAGTRLSVERNITTTATQAQIFNGLETRLLTLRNLTLSRPYLVDLVEQLDLYPEYRHISLETAVNRVQRDISITPTSSVSSNNGPATLTFTLSYVGNDARKAAEVANALARFYIEQNDAMRTKQASKAVQDLDAIRAEAKRSYDDASSKLNAYLTTHANKLPQQQAVKSAAVGRVTAELLSKTTTLNNLKASQSNLRLQIAAAMNQPAAATTAQTREQALATANLELKKLLDAKAGESNTAVIAWRARIKMLQEQPDEPGAPGKATDAATSQLDVYRSELKLTESEIARLTKEIGQDTDTQTQLLNEMNSIPSMNPELDDLTRGVTSAREQLESAQRQYNQAFSGMQIERSQDSDEFHVLEEAAVPSEPAGPNRLALILGGIVTAIVLGLGTAIVRDQFDTSFHTIDELRGFTQVPVLASIPSIVTRTHRMRRLSMLLVGACVLLVTLAVVSKGVYEYAKHKSGITRFVTR